MPGNGHVRFGGRPRGKGPAHTGTSPRGRPHPDLRELAGRPPRRRTLADLQAQLDALRAQYNHHRPHRALDRRHPRSRLHRPPQSHPHPDYTPPAHDRIRHDRIDTTGVVTLAPQRPTPPHRHRTNPRRNPRPTPGPGPQHPHHQRSHRRTPPRTHPRPHQGLPTHRPTTRPQTHKIRTLTWVRTYADVLRHHKSGGG